MKGKEIEFTALSILPSVTNSAISDTIGLIVFSATLESPSNRAVTLSLR